MSLGQSHAWLLPNHLRPPDAAGMDLSSVPNGTVNLTPSPSRSLTPLTRINTTGSVPDGLQPAPPAKSDNEFSTEEEDPRIAMFRERYERTEAKIGALFTAQGEPRPKVEEVEEEEAATEETHHEDDGALEFEKTQEQPAPEPAPNPTRKLDDEDYDEYDEDEEGGDKASSEKQAPAVAPPAAPPAAVVIQPTSPPKPAPAPAPAAPEPVASPPKPAQSPAPKEVKKGTAEEVRRKLEEDKKAMEDSVKRSFQTMFFTLEDDRVAMLDQQKLEETERQIEAEMSAQGSSGQGAVNGTSGGAPGSGHGPLSNVNLGSSSLALKNLIERIDMKRSEVAASDAELRNLMLEVRKNRSKWASEDKIGQEELYEPAEKVLTMLKAETTHSAPFLTRVNKREAPDYYNVITHPMDLGTMTKKLKNMVYKSKQEFVSDLNLIWANCLKYNTNPDHVLRKHALYMRKVTEELEPMIPDVTVRDRAEVEAEERKLQLADLDAGEESDDEPIMTSRGRKAVSKKSRKGRGARPAAHAPAAPETPAPDTQPNEAAQAQQQQQQQPAIAAPAESQSEMNFTPPPGSLTPIPTNGTAGSGGDGTDLDVYGHAAPPDPNLSRPIIDFENPEYKMWKQVTQKDRARVVAERHRLLKGNKLNLDEPALLRTKAGMRRWLKRQKETLGEGSETSSSNRSLAQGTPATTGETLAENIDEEEGQALPDYYDVMSSVPDMPKHLRWIEDADGNAVDLCEDYLHILPEGQFVQPSSKFSRRMDANLRQMQESRKVCSKISIVRQMQVQSQMYQNQFQKYNPEPFIEKDVQMHIMNHNGPVISPWTCRAALQRSVGKVFYSVGFEEYQPSALDAATDIAADFFQKIGSTLKTYMETPRVSAEEKAPSTGEADAGSVESGAVAVKRARSAEEIILHTLNASGMDPESLEAYVKDDVERLGTKLGQIHERLKTHLAELLRPAFNGDPSGDGSAMFNDGSEQFVGGDFALDIDEDFFGFKELGLDKEFGLASLTVPLHLLQNRMFNAHQSQNPATATITSAAFPNPPKFPPITMENVSKQIGLMREFFMAKLRKNDGKPLVEELELPPKQRALPIKPRLPATGKIAPPAGAVVTPHKRPAPSAAKKDNASPSKKKAKKSTAGNGNAANAVGSENKENNDVLKKGSANS